MPLAANSLFLFKAMASAIAALADEEAESKLNAPRNKTDPNVSVPDLQRVLEKYFEVVGTRNFQLLIDTITANGTSWKSKPKVCLLRSFIRVFRCI